MLIADAATDNLLGPLIQAGAFGLLTLVVVYVGRVLIPKIFAEHERLLAEHRDERERDNARNDAAHGRRDAALEKMSAGITAELKHIAGGVAELNGRVKSLEDRTDEHRSLPRAPAEG